MKIQRINYYHARSDLSELTEDQLTDMLRYDNAFIKAVATKVKHKVLVEFTDPPVLVAFPQFQLSGRRSLGGRPTFDRWRSFCVNLTTAHGPENPNLDEWYTFVRGKDYKLVMTTLRAYMEE